MSSVECPSSFRQFQGARVDKVTALPTRLELLLKVAQRGFLAQIAAEVNERSDFHF